MKAYPKPEQSEQEWAAVAQRVLRGEFKNISDSYIESLVTGLRGYADEACAKAVKKLDPAGKYKVKGIEDV